MSNNSSEHSLRSPLAPGARIPTRLWRLLLRHRWCFVLVAALTVAVLVLVGSMPPKEVPLTYVNVANEHVRFTFTVPRSSSTSMLVREGESGTVTIEFDVWDEDHKRVVDSELRECQAISYQTGDLILEALHADCELDGQQSYYLNGHTGYFHSLADAADPHDVERIDTRLGRAELFEISYHEATNSYYDAELPIAIIALDAPVDPNYPTLTVRTSRYTPDRELVRAVLDAIDDE